MSDDCMIRVENRRRADSSWKVVLPPKSVICRYYGLPGGCVRGDKCFYAHGQEDIQKRASECSPGLGHSIPSSSRLVNHSPEDLTKKVFVGGLSSSVESDDLRDFFEEKFGPVIDAVVIESHLGDQVHSRGFGFVTFENEKSVVSAVQAHFVNIFGKKVEIKGAVPRLGCSHLETAKVSSGIPGAFHGMSDVISQRLLGLKLYSVSPNDQAKDDTQGQYRIEKGCEVDNGMSLRKEAACANTTRPTASDCSPPRVAECRNWVPIFEQWLPKFLLEVCNRLKEGEWYPLSSLKGDFRATCGLELDHEAIGFHKLNDFIRSLPHLCRIKIVPVGLGPATHMVLLPAGSRMTTTGSHQIQELHPTCQMPAPSLVETGRSYAAAICQGTTSSLIGSVTFASTNPEMRTMEPHEDHSISRSSSSRTRSSGESLLRESDFMIAENHVNNLLREHALRAPVFTNQSGATLTCNPHEFETVNVSYLRQPSTLVEKSAEKENWDPKRPFGLNGQSADFIHKNCHGCMNSHVSFSRESEFHYPSGTHDPSDLFIHQVLDCNSTTKTLETGACGEEGTRIPLEQLTLTPSAYLQHEQSAPPWAEISPSNREASLQQSSSGSNQYEESAHSNLNPHVAEKARGPLQKLFLLHPTDEDREKLTAACAFGCKRKAIWMAFPCKHFALCSSCRDSFYRYWGKSGDSPCPVCFRVVEKWYALYY